MLGIIGQWSFYGIFRCPFVVPYLSCQSCPVVTCHGRILSMFWGFWLLLPLSAVLFGRAFCGWACPGGLVSQLMSLAAPFRLQRRSLVSRLAPYGKYLGLATALYVYFLLGQPRTNVPIRVGDFFGAVALTFEHAFPLWLWRTGVVLGLLALGLVLGNAWCRFACPTGSLLDIFRKLSIFRVYKTSACNDCNKCLRLCPMGTRPEEPNCTNCGDCLDACAVGAIGIGRKPQA
ncbi:4Fe-4S binding protein [Megalodesulfovibrio gigas]|nr:4Fe-4S binding protein [Megalodesulfovibrio gigas]